MLIEDLENFKASKVLINGKLVASNGKPLFKTRKPAKTRNTMKIGEITEKNLEVKTKKEFMEAINTSQYKNQWDEGDFKKIKNYQRIFLKEIERGI